MPAQYDNCCCCCCRLFLVAHLQLQVPLLQPFLLLLLPLNASLFVASLFVSSNAGRINYECYAAPLSPLWLSQCLFLGTLCQGCNAHSVSFSRCMLKNKFNMLFALF